MTRLPTREEFDKALAFAKTLGIDPGEIRCCIGHWTGGGPFPNAKEKRHYNALIDQSAAPHHGTHSVDDQVSTSDGIYGAHTRQMNTRAFGWSLCGMAGAKEAPLSFGNAPINEDQFMVAACLVACVLRLARLDVEPHTCMFHSEVPAIKGVSQPGKWDVNVLPWRSDVRGSREVGDYFRSMVKQATKFFGDVVQTEGSSATNALEGSKGPIVGILQRALSAKGYHVGKIDEHFGPRTKAALLAFQADHDLERSGIADAVTWEVLHAARCRPDRDVTEDDLRAAGSRSIEAADSIERRSKQAAGGLGALSAVKAVEVVATTDGVAKQAEGTLDLLSRLLAEHWVLLALLAIGALLWFKGPQFARTLRDIRVRDAVTGANDAR